MFTISNETAKQHIDQWLSGSFDADTKASIQKLLDEQNEKELTDAFYKNLEFGTGGLRGIMGVGTNRMNRYTLGMATQGLANYLKKAFPNEPISVAIAHDSRINSANFAKLTAEIFASNGIKVYFFKELRPTPELSFAIRHYQCHSGVVITASHNPREYNGYKAYWSDGAQLTAPHDENVIEEVKKISIEQVIHGKFEGNLIEYIGAETDALYLEKVQQLILNPEAIREKSHLKIVYTPLHGTGITLVPQALKNAGFQHVHIVEEQAVPDGNFPTVVYPNPEEAEALTLALKKAKAEDADLVLATDPDADRVGIALKNQHGNWQLMNGNQTGTLLLNYLITQWKEKNKLTGKEFIVKTIVTTNLIDAIAAKNGLECFNTLTGFKYIASLIREWEGKKTFIAGGEESYGYMIGDFVRDKDSVSACVLIAEICAYAATKGITLFDMLIEIYLEYGLYLEKLVSITKKGKEGTEEIRQMMEGFRKNPPKELGGSKVVLIQDYEHLQEHDLKTGQSKALDFEKSNVLCFQTEDGSKISARPSGTEPKIKFYFSVNCPLASKEVYEETEKKLEEKINRIVKDLGL